MKLRTLAWLGLSAMVVLSPAGRAQEAGYPMTLIPPGKGPFTFPEGYQTPWDKIQIMVTAKMSPNLFVLHGSEGLDPAHPDASGGRAMVLFGPDGVLMVDTENRQVAEKTLRRSARSPTAPIRVLVNTHMHSDHTGANAFFAKQGALIYAQENLRNEMLRPPPRGQRPAGRRRPTWPAFRSRPTATTRRRRAARGHLQHERRDGGLHPDDAVPHRRRHHRALPQGQRDLHRGLLPQLRLSVRRSGQRRLDQGHARRGRSDRRSWPARTRR